MSYCVQESAKQVLMIESSILSDAQSDGNYYVLLAFFVSQKSEFHKKVNRSRVNKIQKSRFQPVKSRPEHPIQRLNLGGLARSP